MARSRTEPFDNCQDTLPVAATVIGDGRRAAMPRYRRHALLRFSQAIRRTLRLGHNQRRLVCSESCCRWSSERAMPTTVSRSSVNSSLRRRLNRSRTPASIPPSSDNQSVDPPFPHFISRCSFCCISAKSSGMLGPWRSTTFPPQPVRPCSLVTNRPSPSIPLTSIL